MEPNDGYDHSLDEQYEKLKEHGKKLGFDYHTTLGCCKNYDEGHPMCEEQACGKCLSFDLDINYLALLETLRKRIDKNTAALEDLINHVFESRELKREYDTWKSQHDYSRIIKKLKGEPSNIKNIDLCHKCDLEYSIHSRNLAGILICPKEEQEAHCKHITESGYCNIKDMDCYNDKEPCYEFNGSWDKFDKKEAPRKGEAEPIYHNKAESTEEWCKRRFETWAKSVMNPDTQMTVWEILEVRDLEREQMIQNFIDNLKEQRIYDDILIAKWRARKDG